MTAVSENLRVRRQLLYDSLAAGTVSRRYDVLMEEQLREREKRLVLHTGMLFRHKVIIPYAVNREVHSFLCMIR